MSELKQRWETICRKCGQCCCEKYPAKLLKKSKRRAPGSFSVNKRFFIDYNRPCSYLDVETGECLVYEERFSTCRSCIPMTVFHALFADYLPYDCGYVMKFRPWVKRRN